MRRSCSNQFLLGIRLVLFSGCLALTSSVDAVAAHLEKIVGNIEKPIFLTAPPDDPRLFFIQEDGRIRIIDEAGQLLPTPYIDIAPLLEYDGLFQGLLGLAFHPDYANNGYFFVDYTMTGGDTRISRFQVSGDPDIADPGSESVVLTVGQPGGDHNGGYIAFGPDDGYLYVSMGDGGFGGNLHLSAQDPALLLGKILRLDVDVASGYQIPADNPFVGVSGYQEEIWAVGLRSPWGMSFDRETHDLWIADVGLNNWEEIDFQPALSTGGENYGWSLMEGNSCYTPPTDCDDGSLTYPIYDYPHGPGCSVNGGFVYRGTQIPEFYGCYFFSDWCTSEIWTLKYDGSSVSELTNRATELGPPSGDSFSFLAGFGQDAAGELYVIDWNWSDPNSGQIFKIVSDVSDVPGDGQEVSGPVLELTLPQPNPFVDGTRYGIATQEDGPLHVSIHSLAGRLVWFDQLAADPSGMTWLEWDGSDSHGTQQAAGVYFLTVRSGGSVRSQSLQLIR